MLELQIKVKQIMRHFIERMFYFTPTFPSRVKEIYLKVSWQNIFVYHPRMQFENQTAHLDHGVGADQFLRFC